MCANKNAIWFLGVARDLGYRPNISARQLASKRSFVISHFHDNPNTDYLSEIYEGMRRACSEQGYYAVAEKLVPQKVPIARHCLIICCALRLMG